MSDHPIASYLRDHPRMIGVLFTMTLLLSQAGAVAANHSICINGP
ncbi:MULTISPECIES: DUF7503 family protein [Haloprofundus]|nr:MULTISPECIES: hypothetical protein [Haloprofundus]